MADELHAPLENLALAVEGGWPNPSLIVPIVAGPDVRLYLPPGAFRIGGDPPDGLVLAGAAPAARTVRLYDMETGELVAETTSAGDGTYAFTGLSARDDGYGVWIVGDAGERGVIIPGVEPGA